MQLQPLVRETLNGLTRLAAALLAATPSLGATSGESFTPARPLSPQLERNSVLESFDAASAARWKISTSSATVAEHAFGHAAATGVSGVRVRWSAPTQSATSSWVSLARELALDESDRRSEGLRVVVASSLTAKLWMAVELQTAYGNYRQNLLPDGPFGPRFEDRLLPFENFRNPAGESVDLSEVERLVVYFGGSPRTIVIDAIETYRTAASPESWFEVVTSNSTSNVFESGEAVTLLLARYGIAPPGASAIELEIVDFYGRNVGTAVREVSTDEPTHQFGPFLFPSGYYEIRAFWRSANERLHEESLVRSSGSMPPGIASFAVMSRTKVQNRQGMRQASPFGLHGATLGVHDLTGHPWKLTGERWRWIEPTRSDRSNGELSPWAQARLAEPPKEPHEFGVLSLTHRDVPPWAVGESPTGPPWKNWLDWSNYLADQVRVYMHQFPHMNPRLYDVTWEIDLDMEPYAMGEVRWTTGQVVDLYARSGALIRSLDPRAVILGPNPSQGVNRLSWFQALFEAGLLDHLDGISIHGYHDGPPPERRGIPEKLAALRALISRHTDRELPIYGLEHGYKALRGSSHYYREAATHLLRASLIFLGEGLRVDMPFYGYDTLEGVGYGIAFNLDKDLKWGPGRIAPKPHLPALATQVARLGEAKPIARARFGHSDLWGYVFAADEHRPVLVFWSAGDTREIQIAAPGVETLIRTDMMGQRSAIALRSGRATISVGPEPQYIEGPGLDALLSIAGVREARRDRVK